MNTLHPLSQALASQGRYGDSTLVHMNPQEVSGLQALARSHGTTLTTNPQTGLPEAFNLGSLLPTLIGAGLTIGSGGALSPLMAGMMTGAGYGLVTGDPMKGLQAGLGAYGGGGLGMGLSAAGATVPGAAVGAAPMNPAGFSGINPSVPYDAATMSFGAPPTFPTIGQNLSQGFKGVGALGTEAGRTAFMGSPAIAADAAKGIAASPATGVGGLSGLAKYGGSMAASSLMGGDDKGEELSGPDYYMRPYDLDITNISGTYDPYESSREREQLSYNFRARDPIKVAQGGAIRYQDGGAVSQPSVTVSPAEADVYRNIANVQQMAGMPMTEVQAMMSARQPFTSYENYNPGTMKPFEAPPMMGSDLGGSFISQKYDVPRYEKEQRTGIGDMQFFTPKNTDIANRMADFTFQLSGRPTDRSRYESYTPEGRIDLSNYLYDPVLGGYVPKASMGYSKGGAVRYQEGGLAAMMRPEEAMTPPIDGRFLRGNGDGMSDEIPATIEGEQDALLSDGEFVIPADIVSHLGNGSSEAGAKILYQMMDRVRKARTGQKEQAEEIDVEEFLPA